MPNLLIFAGTTEGRELLEVLSGTITASGLTVYACVATDYGKELLPAGLGEIHIQSGRMTAGEMAQFIKKNRIDCAVDTTHPYARIVSENIKAACSRAGCDYIRLLRPSGVGDQMDCLFFGSNEEAAAYLDRTDGNVLLTVGSKELSKYTVIRDYQRRIFPRVLPMAEVVNSCTALGFSGKQLICMQGPFSEELNTAMIDQIKASYVVTKDSGETGGFLEKYHAAQRTGAKLLVIGRAPEEEGLPSEAVIRAIEDRFSVSLQRKQTGEQEQDQEQDQIREKGQWFPFFTNISAKRILVVGGGRIAKRRIETLLQFQCVLVVVSPDTLPEISDYAAEGALELKRKRFEASDLEGAAYVLAATNDHSVNDRVYELCKAAGIPVNTADDKEKSDFYFPGLIRKNGITAGVTAEGRDHSLAKRATRAIAACLNQNLRED